MPEAGGGLETPVAGGVVDAPGPVPGAHGTAVPLVPVGMGADAVAPVLRSVGLDADAVALLAPGVVVDHTPAAPLAVVEAEADAVVPLCARGPV